MQGGISARGVLIVLIRASLHILDMMLLDIRHHTHTQNGLCSCGNLICPVILMLACCQKSHHIIVVLVYCG